MGRSTTKSADRWTAQNKMFRDPLQITSGWEGAIGFGKDLLNGKISGSFWRILEENRITLLATREYEHAVVGLSVRNGAPLTSYMRIPHPSGLCVDRKRGHISVASTRNPNLVLTLQCAQDFMTRSEIPARPLTHSPLIPTRADYYPGSLYLHDIAYVDGNLLANAVAQNAVVALKGMGEFDRVWWPKVIDHPRDRHFEKNFLQLNSIAAGSDLNSSFFSASAASISSRRPGHKNFPVDKCGVVFSGQSREVVTRGLTRPHSLRLHDDKLWVDNSGYGELGICEKGGYQPFVKLPGWTRGLTFYNNYAFVGTSRVIPAYKNYAPGLDVDQSQCGIHIVDLRKAKVVGSLTWSGGNQIFAIEWISNDLSFGFPFLAPKRLIAQEKKHFYSFIIKKIKRK